MTFLLHNERAFRGACFATLLALAPCARAQTAAQKERELAVELLDNGSGAETADAPAGDARRLLVPWWTASGTPRGEPASGATLELAPGATLAQPIAAYAPLAEELVVRGRVEGHGRVRLVDGRGDSLELDVHDQEFELHGAQFTAQHGRAPLPRFSLELSGLGDAPARFRDLHALVALPCPSEAELSLELRELCDGLFRTWLERGVDRDGTVHTAFLTTPFDAVTGEIQPERSANGLHPLYESLLDAASVSDVAAWNAALAAYLEDFFGRTFHPATGMPRNWDGVLDLPQDDAAIEVGRYLGFLLDLAERGPEAFRERALQQARKMGETILAHGRLPDRALAVKYVPRDGSPDLGAAPIRQLDVAAPLARLGRKLDDARFADAARSGLAQLEYVHYWGGTWSSIDPDFDDSYGNWGSKTTTMLAAFPQDPVFRRFTARGCAHFAPLWRDALRFGGSIAADQTRCWEFLLRYSVIEPSSRAELEPLLQSAVRSHFKGEQYDNGAWGDMTFASFSPRATLNVGDFSGCPGNLLLGLACMYRDGSALRTDATRAMFTAVLRSSRASYGRKFGWLRAREEAQDRNPAGAELRVLASAGEMLRNLAR